MRIIFLDFDGVIRVEAPGAADGWSLIGPREGFLPEHVARVKRLCDECGAQVVISSDWRDFGLEVCRDVLFEAGLDPSYIHLDWKTDRLSHRALEVEEWLRNSHAEGFVILDDRADLFMRGHAPTKRRLTLCNNRYGFVEELYEEARTKLQS